MLNSKATRLKRPLVLSSKRHDNARVRQKMLAHRYTDGENQHFQHDSTNGHVHIGNSGGGHVPVDN